MWRGEKSCPYGESNSDFSAVEPVANRCTDFPIPAPNFSISFYKIITSYLDIDLSYFSTAFALLSKVLSQGPKISSFYKKKKWFRLGLMPLLWRFFTWLAIISDEIASLLILWLFWIHLSMCSSISTRVTTDNQPEQASTRLVPLPFSLNIRKLFSTSYIYR
jgi:hypothetical protein